MQAAPVDPRTDLPTLGSLPTVARVDAVAVRVVAPNMSPMTLDGTNTYVLHDGDGQPALVLDPGPDDDEHRRRVQDVLDAADLDVAGVVVTHHHPDHAEAAADWASSWDVRVIAASPDVAGPDGRVVAAGDEVVAGPLRSTVIETPGHTEDSISLRLPTGAVCTGDHVLGRGTTVVAHPDGTLEGYLESLRRLVDLGPASLLVGHGPAVTRDPLAVLEYHQAHRRHRLDQLMAVVATHGPLTPGAAVDVIYADYDPKVRPAALSSTLAAVEHLTAAGSLRLHGGLLTVVR